MTRAVERVPDAPARPLPPHGTLLRYTHGCRLPCCRAANAAKHLEWSRRSGVRAREEYHASIAAKHGSSTRYAKGCRCRQCTRKERDDQRAFRARRYARGFTSDGRPRRACLERRLAKTLARIEELRAIEKDLRDRLAQEKPT